MRRSGGRRGGRGGRGGSYQDNNTIKASVLSRLTPNNRNHHIDTNARNQRKFRGVYGVRAISASIATLPTEKKIKDLKQKFIKSYYKMFDQPNRQDLVSLYSEESFLSVSSTHPMPVIHFGRNLLVEREPGKRIGLLFVGRPKVAEVLATLRPTEHFVDDLIVDIPYYMASPMAISAIQLVVTGCFKDTSPPVPGDLSSPLRSFIRTFVLKHTSTDTDGEPVYQIYNDMFMIQSPTQHQIKKYLAIKQETQQSNPSSTSIGGASSMHRNREEKTVSIMTRTRMTRLASVKLLEENQWDEAKAMETFTQLQSKNAIPRDLFQ